MALTENEAPLSLVREALAGIYACRAPRRWEASSEAVAAGHQRLHDMLLAGHLVYGVNTLTGHRQKMDETSRPPEAVARAIMESHVIGEAPYFDAHEARCIGFAKLYAWASGATGVSLALCRRAASLVTSPDFSPRVPRRASYSCGDVIPGAHWARAVFDSDLVGPALPFAPGDVMASINGCFVQVGLALSLIERLEGVLATHIECMTVSHALCLGGTQSLRSNLLPPRAWTASVLRHMTEKAKSISVSDARPQPPVSLRATAQIVDVLCATASALFVEIGATLLPPSGNPLFLPGQDRPVTQASFLVPVLALRVEAVSEAILFALWSALGRVQHLLSGSVPGVPQDGATRELELGLIQMPKLMAARLDVERQRASMRLFASGAETSFGQEDLWSKGLPALEELQRMLGTLEQFSAFEMFAAQWAAGKFGVTERSTSPLLRRCAGVRDRAACGTALADALEALELQRLESLSPIGARGIRREAERA